MVRSWQPESAIATPRSNKTNMQNEVDSVHMHI